MDIEKELKAIRYLLNDIILSIYNLNIAVNELTPDKRQRKLRDPNASGNTISFDLFAIKKEVYDDLVNTYGIDIVNQAWDSNKDDETNLNLVKSSFNFNKALNTFHGNSDIVKCIDIFISDYLNKL